MKITISRLKEVIKEELTDEDIKFLINGLKPLFDTAEKNQKEIDKVKDNVHDLNKDFRWLNGDLQSLEDSVMTINDKLSIKQPSRFAGPDVVRGTSASGEKTNPRGMPTNEEIREMVKQELDELKKKKKTKVSKAGQKRVSKKIGYLVGKEKMDPDQAAAVAYSMEKRGELKKGGKHSVE